MPPNSKNEEISDMLYQCGRLVVGAEMQQIVYKEFLPVVIGNTTLANLGLNFTDKTNYDITVDPSVTNEFATVAYRFGHSLIATIFQGNVSWALSDHFFEVDQFVIGEDGTAWKEEMTDLTQQRCPRFDRFVTDQVTNRLFRNISVVGSVGQDLGARNIQSCLL